jgi:adenosine deaminase
MRADGPLPFAQALRWWVEAFNRTTSQKCEIRLIVDFVRLYPLANAERWLDELLEIRRSSGGERIIGVGLGGPQNSNPLRLYRSVFSRARAEGLLCVAHAGEMGSGTDVGEAVFEIQVDRIGHGLGLSANRGAYRSVLERGIPIESCPTSSVKTGACPDLRNHPLAEWIADGALVTISTDDAALFKTELTLEFLQLHRAFGWGNEVIAKLIANGFSASTMPVAARESYVAAVKASFAQRP